METKTISATVIASQHDDRRALKSAGRIAMLMKNIGILVNRIRTFMRWMYDEAGRI